jgi:SAM-dependent methyltransferase
MGKKLLSPWPCNSYLSAWKTFRLISNENEVTANHLLARTSWPRKENITICDLGCGDGHLIEQLILTSPTKIAKVHLLDPNSELMREAHERVCETNLTNDVVCLVGTAERRFAECTVGIDVILLIHVVYLMENGALLKILSSIPFNTPLYLILDSPDSVFTALWKITAPLYYERALKAHETLKKLPKDNFIIRQSTFKSQIKNPLLLPREDLKQAILSILTYSDFSENMYPTILPILEKHTQEKYLSCKSRCYEILRVETL